MLFPYIVTPGAFQAPEVQGVNQYLATDQKLESMIFCTN
jgi:hypothetical protein